MQRNLSENTTTVNLPLEIKHGRLGDVGEQRPSLFPPDEVPPDEVRLGVIADRLFRPFVHYKTILNHNTKSLDENTKYIQIH